ncbi:MAG TPA: Hsp20/alpha crystallin family protein [Levilinea sp.]|nr:Hsp20/alpha crystallin family protein [Levilinea sp.]
MERIQRDMNRILSSYQRGVHSVPGFPAVNIWTGEEGAVLTAEVPGVAPEDLEISVVGDTLTLQGERKRPEIDENAKFHRQERGYGRFSRTVQLPFPVEVESAEAHVQSGVLKMSLPRAEADKPKRVSVHKV